LRHRDVAFKISRDACEMPNQQSRHLTHSSSKRCASFGP
jgi:hypothetical protein